MILSAFFSFEQSKNRRYSQFISEGFASWEKANLKNFINCTHFHSTQSISIIIPSNNQIHESTEVGSKS